MKQDPDPYGVPDPRWDAARGRWERDVYRQFHGKEMPEWNDPKEQERRRRDIYQAAKHARGPKFLFVTEVEELWWKADLDLRRQADELAGRALQPPPTRANDTRIILIRV